MIWQEDGVSAYKVSHLSFIHINRLQHTAHAKTALYKTGIITIRIIIIIIIIIFGIIMIIITIRITPTSGSPAPFYGRTDFKVLNLARSWKVYVVLHLMMIVRMLMMRLTRKIVAAP